MPPPQTTTLPPPLLRPLVTLDTSLSQALHNLTQTLRVPRPLLLILEYLADFRLFLPITVAILASSPPYLHRPFGTSFITGLIIDLVLVGIIKLIFRRTRPVYNKHMTAAVSADNYSFPSGHTSRVCYVAAFVTFSVGEWQIGVNDRWVWGVWSWAVVTSGSRVLLGRHYVFDVVAGMCLGVLEGLFVFHFVKF